MRLRSSDCSNWEDISSSNIVADYAWPRPVRQLGSDSQAIPGSCTVVMKLLRSPIGETQKRLNVIRPQLHISEAKMASILQNKNAKNDQVYKQSQRVARRGFIGAKTPR